MSKRIVESHFVSCREGLLTEKKLRKAFSNRKVTYLAGRRSKGLMRLGFYTSFSEIIHFHQQWVLKVNFPAKKFGPLPGTQWRLSFADTRYAFLSYDLFIPDDFDFVKGGKLPGLGGGIGNGGGKVPNGFDGWSVRFMFKEEGRLCAYSYTPDMPGKYGEKRFFRQGNRFFYLPKGEWINIGLGIKMNTPGENDGEIIGFINDKPLLTESGVRFRDTYDLSIDHLLFSSFFGGNDLSYAPEEDSCLLFKDFIVEEK